MTSDKPDDAQSKGGSRDRGVAFTQAEMVAAFQEAAEQFRSSTAGTQDQSGALTAEEWVEAIYERTGEHWSRPRFITMFKQLQKSGLAQMVWVPRRRVDGYPITKPGYKMIAHDSESHE